MKIELLKIDKNSLNTLVTRSIAYLFVGSVVVIFCATAFGVAIKAAKFFIGQILAM